jgi:hypothetical protein
MSYLIRYHKLKSKQGISYFCTRSPSGSEFFLVMPKIYYRFQILDKVEEEENSSLSLSLPPPSQTQQLSKF